LDIIEAIKTRKSIRGYKSDPVPRDVLREILEVASRAPSSMNTQPWEFTVVAGDVLEKIKQANEEKFNAGEPGDLGWENERFKGKCRERQVALAIQLFQSMGIAREERGKRTDWERRGFRYFDAPAVIVISVDREHLPRTQFDTGAVSQTIALAALEYGLGTCMHDQGISYPGVLRELAGIPESKRMIICLSIGYPDGIFPADRVVSAREPIDSITTWCGL
jgi:nitroreductase